MINRKISLTTVIADRVFNSEEAQEVVQLLSREAAEMGLSRIIKELGQVESIAADPLKDVPEVLPASRNKVCIIQTSIAIHAFICTTVFVSSC